MRKMRDMLINRQLFKTIPLFFDIETLQYNEAAGQITPTDYKNVPYSVAVSWIEAGEVEYEIFSNFKLVFDIIIDLFKDRKKKPLITMNAHNSNKYDNHYLRFDLKYYFPEIKVENFYIRIATTDKSNENSLRIKDLSKAEKEAIILEKRIKSRINLDMTFYLRGIKFETIDNWVKTNVSMKVLGKKLYRIGVVTEDELKTDFDYTQYNKQEDMTDDEARSYALEVFNQLNQNELKYIRNDVILLAKSVYYYSDIFKGFDYKKMTFTSNILESYNTNDLTSFQLLNRIGEGKSKIEIRYTDYQFANQNFYDYLKPFYRGGLNFYNQFFIGKILRCGVFGMDIHSSYPFAMHKMKIPTFLKSYEEFEQPDTVQINYTDDEFTLFQLSKEVFDKEILGKIDSIILKQLFTKYYATNDFINVNTYFFKMLDNILGIRLTEIKAYSRVTFETRLFGSRKQIEEFYYIKTQAKYENMLDFKSPYDITITDEINPIIYTSEEVDNSKVNLNGLYGIPALRPHFNLFRLDEDGDYINIENGHKNAERNIIFSIFVTAVSLWNLLDPFQYLTQKEIDENFIYCDTDSLYFKQAVLHKFPDSLFTDFHLGTWELEHSNLSEFYVLNHKKYAYWDYNKDEGKELVRVRSGGVSHDSFNLHVPFDEFIEKQFSHGVELINTKSILNKQGVISIYPSITKLEVGGGYPITSNSQYIAKYKEKILEEVKEQVDEFKDDVLYVESVIGTFSLSDIFPYTNDMKTKRPLVYLEIKQDKIKERLATV